jgi:hypothetical protein
MLGLSGGAAAVVALGLAGCTGGKGSGGGGGGDAASPSAAAASEGGRISAPPADGVLAANYNQSLDAIDFAQLEAVSATWLRGFYVMPDADRSPGVADQPGMRKLLAAADRGYRTVLTLKFPYDTALPTPGSPEMRTALDRLDKVLAVAMGEVDIVTVGNEPFYETPDADKHSSRINDFYEALARHTVQYRERHGGAQAGAAVYMGALTGLERSADRTPQTKRWIQFVAGNRSIAGVDIHPHVASAAEAQDYVDYVLPWLRPDQKFLATEFSLVQLWKAHLTDPVPAAFASRYGLPHGTRVWQVIGDALKQPFTQQKWDDFLHSCAWFQAHRDFLTDQLGRFRKTGKFAVAGYGITQDSAMSTDFGPGKTPWVLNSLFCPHTVQNGSDGLPGRNPTWCGEFRALQRT